MSVKATLEAVHGGCLKFSKLILIVDSSSAYCCSGKKGKSPSPSFSNTLAKNSLKTLAVSLSFVVNVPSGTFSLLTLVTVLVFERTYLLLLNNNTGYCMININK